MWLTQQQADALVQQREQFRQAQQFEPADAIRKKLLEHGFIVEDDSDGTRLLREHEHPRWRT